MSTCAARAAPTAQAGSSMRRTAERVSCFCPVFNGRVRGRPASDCHTARRSPVISTRPPVTQSASLDRLPHGSACPVTSVRPAFGEPSACHTMRFRLSAWPVLVSRVHMGLVYPTINLSPRARLSRVRRSHCPAVRLSIPTRPPVTRFASLDRLSHRSIVCHTGPSVGSAQPSGGPGAFGLGLGKALELCSHERPIVQAVVCAGRSTVATAHAARDWQQRCLQST